MNPEANPYLGWDLERINAAIDRRVAEIDRLRADLNLAKQARRLIEVGRQVGDITARLSTEEVNALADRLRIAPRAIEGGEVFGKLGQR